MSTEQPGGGLFPAPPPKRRPRSRLGPVIIAAVTAIVVGGGALVVWQQDAIRKAQGRPWMLPEGTPSMAEAKECLATGHYPCAEADMLAYLEKYPNDAAANALLAVTLTRDGRHKESIFYYQKAEKLGVSAYDFHADFARSLDAMGDTEGAIKENRQALEVQPKLVDVRATLADQLVRKGRGREALDLLQSFDRELESQGYPPYFDSQVRRIERGMGGEYAKAAAEADGAVLKAPQGQTLVRGEPLAGTLTVPVSIDGAPAMRFAVDSGASLIAMPAAEARPYFVRGLIRPIDLRGIRPMQMANGTVVPSQVYNLRSVKVGDRELKNVLAAVYPGHGPRLLGQSFLKRFKSWSIDNGRRVLVLTD